MPEHAIEAKRHSDDTQNSHRHHGNRDHKHSEEICQNTVVRQPVKVVW
jgi:hypothetical protein